MNRQRHFTPPVKTYTAIAAALLAATGLVALAIDEVKGETAQAHALVAHAPGKSDEARGSAEVVSLERARLLAPRAEFVRAALVGRDVKDGGSALAHAASWITPREWSQLATVFGWISGLCLAVVIGGWGAIRWARRLAVGSGVALLLSLGGFFESDGAARALAVVTREAGLLVAPYDGAGAAADLAPGVVVVLGPRYGAFVHVRGPSGDVGWVNSGALESVVGANI